MHQRLITVNDRMQRGYVYKLVEPEGRNFSPEFRLQLSPAEMLRLRGCLETFGEGGWPGRGVIPDGCRSQSGQPHVDPGHPSAA